MVFRRFARIARVIHMMNQSEGTTIRIIMQELEITERSVYRLLEGLELLNIPFFSEQVPGERTVRYKLLPEFASRLPGLSLPKLELNLPELISLCMASADAGAMSGTVLEQALLTARGKLGAVLPENLSGVMGRLENAFVACPGREKFLDGKEEFVESLVLAIISLRRCRVRYFSFRSNREKVYLLDPLHFFEHQGGLYLFAHILEYNEVRTLAVHRIMGVEMLDETFNYPVSFDVQEKLKEPFGIVANDPVTVTVRMSAQEACYAMEQRFFAEKEVMEEPDGSLIVTFTTSGRRDLLSWVMGALGEVEVLLPLELRKEAAKIGIIIKSRHGLDDKSD